MVAAKSPRKKISKPELIREILRRIFADLERKYRQSGRPPGPCGEPIPPRPAPGIGGDNGRRLERGEGFPRSH
jgi:hypothetical protein